MFRAENEKHELKDLSAQLIEKADISISFCIPQKHKD